MFHGAWAGMWCCGGTRAMGEAGRGALRAMGEAGRGALRAMGEAGRGALRAMGEAGPGALRAMGEAGPGALRVMGEAGRGALRARASPLEFPLFPLPKGSPPDQIWTPPLDPRGPFNCLFALANVHRLSCTAACGVGLTVSDRASGP